MMYASNILYTGKLDSMYFAALFNSLIMACLQPFLMQITMYKAFIIGDALLNLLNLYMFIVVALKLVKHPKMKIGILGLIPIYFLGWPCWSWIKGGFVYYGAGVTNYLFSLVCLIQFHEETSNKKIEIAKLLLSIYCVTICYLMFTPMIILTIGIYAVCINWNRVSKKTMLLLMGSIVGIGIIAMCIIFFGFMGGKLAYLENLKNDGGVYREVYKEFIIVFPLTVWGIIYKIKHKQIDATMIATCVVIIVTFVALFARLEGFISSYYYFKLYFPLWTLMLISAFEALQMILGENRETFSFLCISGICLVLVDSLNLNVAVSGEYAVNPKPIFTLHKQSIDAICNYHDYQSGNKEGALQLAQFVNDNLKNEEVILYNDGNPSSEWYRGFTGQTVDYNSINNYENQANDFVEFLYHKDVKYFALNQDSDIYNKNSDYFEKLERVYNNGYYGVYKLY